MTSPGTLNRPIVTVFVGAVLALSSGTSPQAEQNAVAAAPACADGGECLCDSSYQDCRSSILQLINNETVGIDVSFWFMTDWRYSSALIKRWQAGVPVRIILDTQADPTYGGNKAVRDTLVNAGAWLTPARRASVYVKRRWAGVWNVKVRVAGPVLGGARSVPSRPDTS